MIAIDMVTRTRHDSTFQSKKYFNLLCVALLFVSACIRYALTLQVVSFFVLKKSINNDSLCPRKNNVLLFINIPPHANEQPIPTAATTTQVSKREFLFSKEIARRHPPKYWSGLDTIRAELVQFWENTLQIPVLATEKDIPPIPNEFLLTFANRYDLKYAINSVYSGREALACALALNSNRNTPSRIIGGRWYSDDCLHTREVQLLYRHAILGSKLQEYKPHRQPAASSTQSSRLETGTVGLSKTRGWNAFSGRHDKWRHQPGRNSWGFWNITTVETELFEFLHSYNTERNSPTIWAPRLSELSKSNRKDLHMSLIRFYNTYHNICNHHHLIPYHEWSYFDSVHQLLSQLHAYYYPEVNKTSAKKYLTLRELFHNQHISNKQLIFPEVSGLKHEGYVTLYQLIQRHGGRQSVAKRFGIALSKKERRKQFESQHTLDYDYGPFSLTFALSLMIFVREQMMHMKPKKKLNGNASNSTMSIRMPTQQELFSDAAGDDGKIIHGQIQKYGGYENVARRLGLVW